MKSPMQFASEWYSVEEVAYATQMDTNPLTALNKIPPDIYSHEFSVWLTDQYRLAMAKGIEIGRREVQD